MNSFEKGRRRVPVSLLPVIAHMLNTTLDALVAEHTTPPEKTKSGKRGPAPKIQQQLEQIETLPKAKQRVVSQMIDAMLQANTSG